MIVEAKPWVVGQDLTGTNGVEYTASGPSSYKRRLPDPVEPPAPVPESQELYLAGDVLPVNMQGTVKVCVGTDSEVICLGAGDEVPADVIGSVFVDERTLRAQWMQDPVKDGVKPFIAQSDEPSAEQVESGVCLWRSTLDGCLYSLMADGTWFSSDKRDTVDGYSVQGVADGTQLDLDGNAIPAGNQIITYYDASGLVVNSKDCTDDNTYTIRITAVADGIDDAGNPYSAGDILMQTPDGDLFCQTKTLDSDTVDGFAVQGVSDGTQLDADGLAIPANTQIITFFDENGDVINSKDCTDEFAVLQTATEAFVDDAGNNVEVGDQYTMLAGGARLCAEKAIDTDTQDGYSLLGTSDGSQLALDGAAIDAGAEVINYYDANGAYLYSKDCTDDDTFGVPKLLEADGLDVYGNAVTAGSQVIEFPDGSIVCTEKTAALLTKSGEVPASVLDASQIGTALAIGDISKEGCRHEVVCGPDGKLWSEPGAFCIEVQGQGLNVPQQDFVPLFTDAQGGIQTQVLPGELEFEIVVPDHCQCGIAHIHFNGAQMVNTFHHVAADANIINAGFGLQIQFNNSGTWTNLASANAIKGFHGADATQGAGAFGGASRVQPVPGVFCPGDVINVKLRKTAILWSTPPGWTSAGWGGKLLGSEFTFGKLTFCTNEENN